MKFAQKDKKVKKSEVCRPAAGKYEQYHLLEETDR